MRFLFYLITLAHLVCALKAEAQSTFIKRYKNTTQPEGSSTMCNLPGNRIAIAGNQKLASFDYVPIVIITDSSGNQLRHFVDSSCYECSVYGISSDSTGYIYMTGTFFGKAGLAKYDTLGNKFWQKSYSPNGLSSSFRCIKSINNSLLVVGGDIASDINGGYAIIVAYNNAGDTLWGKHYRYSFATDIFDIGYSNDIVYATGVVSDTVQPQQRVIFARVTLDGQYSYFSEIETSRKWGYGIIPLSPDSILIGGRADNSFGGTYSFLSLVDSMGDVRYTIEDPTSLLNNITKMDFDFSHNKLYVYDYDTIQSGGDYDFYNHIGAYDFPPANLQQYLFSKTITGTSVSSSRGLAVATDGTILHTAYANDQRCPYLLKANENTCADLACDTAFFSGINIPEFFSASARLYPNPVSSDFVFIELQSDDPLETVEVNFFDLSGRLLCIEADEQIVSPDFYRMRLNTGNNLANGVYMVKLKVNGRHYINSRFVKTG
jgi:hypothetical protein